MGLAICIHMTARAPLQPILRCDLDGADNAAHDGRRRGWERGVWKDDTQAAFLRICAPVQHQPQKTACLGSRVTDRRLRWQSIYACSQSGARHVNCEVNKCKEMVRQILTTRWMHTRATVYEGRDVLWCRWWGSQGGGWEAGSELAAGVGQGGKLVECQGRISNTDNRHPSQRCSVQ